jgi:hypothetical protein
MSAVEERPFLRATLELPGGGYHAAVQWGGPLTPYALQEIVDDAMHAGPGASLDVRLAGTVTDHWVERLRRVRERLCARGVEVHLRRAAPRAEGAR